MTPSSDLVVLVLAAGGSTRFGSPKQLADIDGVTLLERVVDSVKVWAPGRVVVVLGAQSERIREVIDNSVEVVICPEWGSGMSASLAAGVAATAGDPNIKRCAVVMGDTLGLDPHDAAAVLAVSDAEPDAVVQATYDHAPSHPTVFPRGWFERLVQLTGDHGARELLRSGYETVVRVPLAKSALIDVDIPTDLPPR